jgi:hypothetical protein
VALFRKDVAKISLREWSDSVRIQHFVRGLSPLLATGWHQLPLKPATLGEVVATVQTLNNNYEELGLDHGILPAFHRPASERSSNGQPHSNNTRTQPRPTIAHSSPAVTTSRANPPPTSTPRNNSQNQGGRRGRG